MTEGGHLAQLLLRPSPLRDSLSYYTRPEGGAAPLVVVVAVVVVAVEVPLSTPHTHNTPLRGTIYYQGGVAPRRPRGDHNTERGGSWEGNCWGDNYWGGNYWGGSCREDNCPRGNCQDMGRAPGGCGGHDGCGGGERLVVVYPPCYYPPDEGLYCTADGHRSCCGNHSLHPHLLTTHRYDHNCYNCCYLCCCGHCYSNHCVGLSDCFFSEGGSLKILASLDLALALVLVRQGCVAVCCCDFRGKIQKLVLVRALVLALVLEGRVCFFGPERLLFVFLVVLGTQ